MAKLVLNTIDGRQEVELDASVYREAQDAGFTNVRAYMNNLYPVPAGEPSAFNQACVQNNMIVGRNREYGIAPTTLNAITEGVTIGANGTAGLSVGNYVVDAKITLPSGHVEVADLQRVTVAERVTV